jgi:uncharacterized protein (DUF433 family)
MPSSEETRSSTCVSEIEISTPVFMPWFVAKKLVVNTSWDAVRSAAGDLSTYASDVAYERISIDPNRMSGLPCIRGTRVTVSAVLGQLAAGLTIPELLVDFPYLDRADVLAALEFAAAAVQERELPLAQWA